VGGDALLGRTRCAGWIFGQRAVGGDGRRKPVERNPLSAKRGRHPLVDLGDEHGRVQHGIGDVVDADPQRARPVLVGRGNLHQAHVTWQPAFGEHPR
jgi:hypothetical protein